MPTVDEKYTRCPGCLTVFRVTPAQLALRDGQVRCGHCRTVFDGHAQMISLAPMPRESPEAERDELALGPPTVTLRSARALDPVPDSSRAIPEPSFRTDAPDVARTPKGTIRTITDTDADAAQRSSSDRRVRRKIRLQRRMWAAAVPVLVALLIGQALFHFRDALAAHWPASKPALMLFCKAAGCAIRPPRDVAGLAIDASDLQADPAHKGLLILSATIRNRATIALAYPYLELTLTDSNDQVVVRRALAPPEYASGVAEITSGIPANGEVLVKLFVDASATTQAGYRLYLFYP
jgi:predicted Zn finger-like uncharacterized protein